MAYLDRTDPRSRATAVIGVGAVHALIAAGLIAGLAVNGFVDRHPNPMGTTVVLPPPPPPPPQPQPRSSHSSLLTAPQPLLPIPQPVPTVAPYDPNEHLGPIDPLPQPVPTFAPTPTPQPSFAPKGASPLGNPGRWITTEDYPPRALRSGEEGLAGYRLVIASSGKVTTCEIVRSSGSPDLDRETCRLLSKRAQFAPATDNTGSKVVGTFSGSVRWDIPD
jgi:protein TonB